MALWLTIFFTCRGCTSVGLSVSLYRISYRIDRPCRALPNPRTWQAISACDLIPHIAGNIFLPSYNFLLRANIILFSRLYKKNYKITLDFIIFAP
nr:MAG TPA: hypothetical protein [Caudoviricetes sp.]